MNTVILHLSVQLNRRFWKTDCRSAFLEYKIRQFFRIVAHSKNVFDGSHAVLYAAYMRKQRAPLYKLYNTIGTPYVDNDFFWFLSRNIEATSIN